VSTPSATAPPPGRPGRGPEVVAPASGGGFPLWAKWLLGCGFVLLVVVIVGGVAVYLGIQRLTRPGRTLEARQVVSERSVGWMRVEPIVEDPGMKELTRSLFLVLQRLGQRERREELPEWMRKWYDIGQAQQGYNPALEWFLPREMTLAFEPRDGEGPPSTTETVAALNLGFLARIIGWVVTREAEKDHRLRELRGHRVVLEESAALAFLDGTMLLAGDLEAMERLLERIDAGGAEGELLEAEGAAADPTPGAPTSGDWDLYGRIDNRRGDFENAMTGLTEWLGADPVPLEGTVEEAVFRVDVVTAETLEAELVLDVTSEAAARAWLRALDEHRAALEYEVLEIELDRHATGRRVRAEWKLQGLDQWLAGLLVTTFEEAEARAEADPGPVEDPGTRELPAEDPASP
jgi:hypothetical protein